MFQEDSLVMSSCLTGGGISGCRYLRHSSNTTDCQLVAGNIGTHIGSIPLKCCPAVCAQLNKTKPGPASLARPGLVGPGGASRPARQARPAQPAILALMARQCWRSHGPGQAGTPRPSRQTGLAKWPAWPGHPNSHGQAIGKHGLAELVVCYE